MFLDDGTFFNAEVIRQGHARVSTRYPSQYQDGFQRYEREAQEVQRGLWQSPSRADLSQAAGEQTVYVTRTGRKYHRSGCRHLARSSIPILLKHAAARYDPCLICAPPVLKQSQPRARPAEVARTKPAPKAEVTVYVTRTGSKYHRGSCYHLRRSMIPMSLTEAARLYSPCSVCRPPVP